MEIDFVWNNTPPDHPAAETIEGGLQFAADHFDDPRGIREQIVKAYIALDDLKLNVVGVGWSQDDKKRLVILRYSIIERVSSCAYYESQSPSPP